VKRIETIAELRSERRAFPQLGFVPTMGFLHDSHLSLVALAKRDCGAVAVSIFVNPNQFGASEDLSRYPRDIPRDLSLLENAGVDLVFTSTPEVIYPAGFATRIEVGAIAQVLEGAARPGHFLGVATVVAKLLNIVQPGPGLFWPEGRPAMRRYTPTGTRPRHPGGNRCRGEDTRARWLGDVEPGRKLPEPGRVRTL
jgi:pantoate--beta-alanine ligase